MAQYDEEVTYVQGTQKTPKLHRKVRLDRGIEGALIEYKTSAHVLKNFIADRVCSKNPKLSTTYVTTRLDFMKKERLLLIFNYFNTKDANKAYKRMAV